MNSLAQPTKHYTNFYDQRDMVPCPHCGHPIEVDTEHGCQKQRRAETYNALSIDDLAAAIAAKTGCKMESAEELQERKEQQQREHEEAARLRDRADYEARLDDETCGDIRSAIESNDWDSALALTLGLWRPDIKECYLRAVTRRFDLVECPCCNGRRGVAHRAGWLDCELCNGCGQLPRPLAAEWVHSLETRRAG